MGPEWENCLVWIDGSAEIVSGDFVQLTIKYRDGVVTQIIKRLEYGLGQWWGCCVDGVFPIGRLVRPSAIKKIVAREPMKPMHPPIPVPKVADESTRKLFAELAAPVIAEWERNGYRRNVVFPGLDVVNFGGTPR